MSESLSQQERELLSTPIRPNSDTSPLNVFPTVGSRDEPHSDITDEQLAAIDAFHQSVAKRFSIVLSDLLQQIVDVQLQPLAIDTYSKFIFSRTSPTCLVTLNARPLRDQLGIDFAPNVLYPLIDCMLGGGRQPVEPPNRPLTQIERRLTIRITNVLLNELHDAWEHVLAVDLSIDQIETNAQRVRIVAPAEETITMTFRTRVSDQTGDITLCLP
ncbi:MAG: hypothetical protein KDA51_01295, partial [Planctomycetales bacterium]|nr:hypothetical protein [Planctomycetales bacterium]